MAGTNLSSVEQASWQVLELVDSDRLFNVLLRVSMRPVILQTERYGIIIIYIVK